MHRITIKKLRKDTLKTTFKLETALNPTNLVHDSNNPLQLNPLFLRTLLNAVIHRILEYDVSTFNLFDFFEARDTVICGTTEHRFKGRFGDGGVAEGEVFDDSRSNTAPRSVTLGNIDVGELELSSDESGVHVDTAINSIAHLRPRMTSYLSLSALFDSNPSSIFQKPTKSHSSNFLPISIKVSQLSRASLCRMWRRAENSVEEERERRRRDFMGESWEVV